MKFGYFDDPAREYVITRPDTPRAWSNYLGSRRYGAIITNNAGGYSFTRSPASGRFLRHRYNSVPMDLPGRQFYLRDRGQRRFLVGRVAAGRQAARRIQDHHALRPGLRGD